MANQRIDIDVGLKVDKTGLNQIKSSLQEIKNLTAQDLMKIGGHTDIQKAERELKSLKTSIGQIDGALEKAFNTDLGTLNVSKFNQALKGMNLNQVYKDFSAAGAAGQTAFRNVTSQILTTNMQLKQTHNFLNNMATTMANTVKWGVASSVMNNFTGSVQKAYGYVKSLDTSLNDIRIVTSKSADEMERFAVKANNAAKELGKSTTDYTKASLIYYQQGLSDEDVEARAETTLKAANVTGQSGEAVSEQLTAVWNGYKVSAEEAELYIDKLAAVAAKTAADLEELSTGMSKVASAADLMGVDIDQLNAQMATIVSVTRQAPESVGTALKTIYARMGDIESGLDAETTLGHYTEEMKAMGVNVLDANGKLRDMGSVIEEIGGKWQSMSREQQIALSQTMAGTRQYNNLLSLFDNWDMYTKALETSANAAGTLQEQQDTYMESTQAHLNQLRAASEDLYDSLLDPKGLNPLIDGLTTVTSLFANFVDSIGGGSGVLLGLGALGTKVFSQQIATGLATTIKNLQNTKYNAEQVSAQFQILNQFKGLNIKDDTTQKLIKWKEELLSLGSLVTAEQHNEANALMQSTVEIKNQAEAWELNKQNAEAYLQKSNISNQSISGLKEDDASAKNMEILLKAQEERYLNAEKNSQRYRQSLEELDVAIIELGRAEEQYAAGTTELTNAENKAAEALQKVKGNMSTVQDSAKTMLGLLDSQGQEYKELTTAINEYNKVKNSGEETTIQEAVTKVVNAYTNAARRIQSDTKNTRAIVSREANGASQDFQVAIGDAQAKMDNFTKSLQLTGKIDSIVKTISSLSSAAMALNSVSRIGSIIDDESLSNTEKMTQIMMSLSMITPVVGKGISSLTQSYGAAKDVIAAKTAVTEAEQAVSKISTQLAQKEAQAEILEFQATRMANTSEEQSTLLKQASNVQKEISALNSKKEAAAEGLEAAQQKLVNAEEKKGIGIKLALLAIQHPIATAIGVGLVGALGAAVFAWQKHNKAVKESVETLKESVSELDSSTSELENLESSLKGVQDQLDELYSKGELSITDKEDIANLEKERIELETQLALQKEINAEKQKQTALDAQDALDKGAYDYGKKEEQSVVDVQGNQSVFNAASEESRDAWVEGQVARYGERFRDQAEQLANSYYEKYHGEITSQMMEDLDTLKSSLDAAKASGMDETATELQAKIEEVYNSTGMLDDTVLSSVNAAFQGDTAQQNQFHETLQSGDPTAASGWTDEDLAKAGLAEEQIEALKTAADAAGISLDTLVNKYKELGNEEIAGTFENNLNKIRAGVEGAGVEYDRGSVMRPSMEGVATSTLNQLQEEYGVDDDFINRSLEKVDFSKIDYTNFAESLKAAMETAMVEQSQEDGKQRYDKKRSENIEEFDFDEEQYDNLVKNIAETAEASDELDESLKENGEAALEVAKDLMRYDKACESVKDSSEDWMKALKSGNLQDQSEAINEMAEAYGNLLDIDGDSLSQDFLTNTENLELLQQAANGSEEAYESLQAAAAQDILMTMGFSGEDALAQFENDLAYIQGFDSDVFGNIAELKAGASLDDDVFLQGLTDMVNAAGMTAEQATDYLSSMGVDAEVETDTVDTPETSTVVTGYTPKVTWEDRSFNIGPASFDYRVPSLRFDTITDTVETGKQIAANSLKVTSAKKSSGGGFKHKNASHGGGSKGGGKKSGGGGGKGGGGSTPKHTTQDKTKGSVDRYRKINNELDELASRFEKLAKAQERLFGKDLYNNLTKQLDVLNKQIKASRQKLQIAKDEKKELQNQLKKKGFKFDKDGEISNYAKRVQYYEDQVNKYKKEFNNLSAKQQAGEKGEKLKEKIDKAEKKLNQVLDLIGDYDEVMDTIDEINDAIVEAAYEKIELKVQKFKLSVELRLDASEAIKDLADFKEMIYDSGESIQKTLDNAFKTVEDIKDSGVFGDPNTGDNQIVRGLHHKITNTMKALDSINKGVVDDYSSKYVLKNNKGEYINEDGKVVKKPVFNEALAMETLEELTEELVDELEYVYDVYDQMLEGIVTTTDNVIEAHEKYRDALEEVQSILEHAMNMVTMIKGEDAYEDIGAILTKQLERTGEQLQKEREASSHYEAQKKSLQTNIDALSNKIATQQAIADDTSKTEDEREEASIKIANLEKERAALQESYEMYDEALQDSYATQREYVEQYTQLLVQQYENAIAQASKTFTSTLLRDVDENGKVLSELNMEGAQYEWDNLARDEEKYLDAVNEAYELKSLENKINESINSTDSLAVQKRLNQFKEEELKKLREKDRLTQYDVDRANQLYEIELKKIALEEAQNNKSKMRLRRDASGNYSYQFVADEDNVADAQQELDDAVNSLYNMDKDQYKQELQELQNLHQEYEDFRTWYSQQSAEFRAANENWYKDQCKAYEDQMIDSAQLAEDTKTNMVQSANLTILESSKSTQDEITLYTTESIGQLVPFVNTAFGKMSSAINGDEDSFRTNSQDAMKAVLEASTALDTGLTQLAQTIGGANASKDDLTTITSTYYTKAIEGADEYAKAQSDNITKTKEEAEAVRNLTKEMRKLLNTKTLLNSVQAVEDSYEYQEKQNEKEANKIDGKKTTTTKKKTTTTKKKTTTTKKTTKKKEDKLTSNRKKGIAAAIYYDGASGSGWGNDPKRAERLKSIFGKRGGEVQEYLNTYWSKLQSGKKNPITDFYNDKDGKLSGYHYDSAKKYDEF